MIELNNLSKTYKGRHRNECRALCEVSFSLPDKGMVFVLGKSGSGKSTLLNIMGGLDSATDGELLIDGNPFSELTSAMQDDYRSLYVGFIFQDYCLLEGLTVAENVRLSLDLIGEKDNGEVERYLKEVGLYEQRGKYPRELSGGQCQRVAIARALAKSPRIILADEPTGNLDSRTAKQILDILKELSHDRLVVVVSHNADDARHYGDRIIELGDGRIVRDVERNESAGAPLISDKLITLPRGEALTDEELRAINEKLSEPDVRITQAKEPFSTSKKPAPSERKPLAIPKPIRPSAMARLTAFFLGGGYGSTALTTVTLFLLSLLLCFAQTFALFDSNALIRDALEVSDDHSVSLHKGYYDDAPSNSLKTDKTIAVTDEDIAAFYDAGYEGSYYLLYTTQMAFSFAYDKSPVSTGEIADTMLNYSSPYAQFGNGVLATNEAFVASIYGKDGKLSLLAGEISESANQDGIIVSDYVADCIIYHNKSYSKQMDDPYAAIIKNGYIAGGTDISAIFETGYKERYADLLAKYDEISAIPDESARNEAIKELVASDVFMDFANEVDKYLAIGYFLGENFNEAINTDLSLSIIPCFHNTSIYSGGTPLIEEATWLYSYREECAPGTALIGANVFNKMFGTNYSYNSHDDFSPVELTLVGYANGASELDEPLYSHTVTIVGFSKKDDGGIYFNRAEFDAIRKYDHYAYAVYFDNTDSAATLYDTGDRLGFYTNNLYLQSVNTVRDIVEIFRVIFVYAGLAVALVYLLLSAGFSLRTLRRKKKDVGIIRALGGKTNRIALCFMCQVLLLGIFVTALSLVAAPLLINTANTALVGNLAHFLNNPTIANLYVLRLTPLSLLSIPAVLFPSLLLSLGVPMLFVRRVKPMRIIRSSK